MGLAVIRTRTRPAWGTRALIGPGGDPRSGWSSHVSQVSGSKQGGLVLREALSPPGLFLRHQRDFLRQQYCQVQAMEVGGKHDP